MKLAKNEIEKFMIVHNKLSSARIYHELSQTMIDPDADMTIKKYLEKESNKYFFWFVYSSFLNTVIVELDAAFQKGSSAKNSIYRIDSLKTTNDLQKLLDKHKETIKGVCIIRNNSSAHIPISRIHENEMYRKANVSANSISELLSDFCLLFNTICNDNHLEPYEYEVSDSCKNDGESTLKAFMENRLPPEPRFKFFMS